MKLRMSLFAALLLIVFSCGKEEVLIPEDLNSDIANREIISVKDQNEIKVADLPIGKKCCQGTSLTSELITDSGQSHGMCCTYRFTFVKNPFNDGVNECGYTIKGASNILFQNQSIAVWDTEVCINEDGSCNSQNVTVYSHGERGLLKCAEQRVSTNCACDYTLAQGIQVGAQQAQQNNCNENSSAYLNTIRDFMCMCPEYVQGFKAGWVTYCSSGQTGGCTTPQPNPDCDCELNAQNEWYWDCNE